MRGSRISEARVRKQLDHACIIIPHRVGQASHGVLDDLFKLCAVAQHLVECLWRGKRREPLMLIAVGGDLMPTRGKSGDLLRQKPPPLTFCERRAEIARIDIEGAFHPVPIENIRKAKVGRDAVIIAQRYGLIAKARVSHIKRRICHDSLSFSPFTLETAVFFIIYYNHYKIRAAKNQYSLLKKPLTDFLISCIIKPKVRFCVFS